MKIFRITLTSFIVFLSLLMSFQAVSAHSYNNRANDRDFRRYKIAGNVDGSESSRDEESPGRFVSINVQAEVIHSNGHRESFNLETTDVDLPHRYVSKEELLERIMIKVNIARPKQRYEVYDTGHLHFLDRYGYQLQANSNGQLDLLIDDPFSKVGTNEDYNYPNYTRKFRLEGKIILKEKEFTITDPATTVDFRHTITVTSEDLYGNRQTLGNPLNIEDVTHYKVGDNISSQTLSAHAQKILDETINRDESDPYKIVRRDQAYLIMDGESDDRRQDFHVYDGQEGFFNHVIRPRQKQDVYDYSRKDYVSKNSDSLSENYTVVRESQLPYWGYKAQKARQDFNVYYYNKSTLLHTETISDGNILAQLQAKDGQNYRVEKTTFDDQNNLIVIMQESAVEKAALDQERVDYFYFIQQLN
ncbi:hypothetical protein ACR3IL_03775 [Streptococcus iniae]|nr:hypothetical protein BKX95_00645 [Streptococcus iniae]